MSLHLAKAGRGRVAVCSDHIGCVKDGPPLTNVEKLFLAGQWSVCGIAGFTADNAGESIGQRIKELAAGPLADSPREFLSALSEQLVAVFPRLFENHRPQLCFDDDTTIFFVAFFLKRSRAGLIDLLELQFPLILDDQGQVVGSPQIVTKLEGVLAPGPFVYRLSPSPVPLPADTLGEMNVDASDATVIAGMETATAQVSSSFPGEVSLTLDIAVIESAGVRWLQKRTDWTPSETLYASTKSLPRRRWKEWFAILKSTFENR